MSAVPLSDVKKHLQMDASKTTNDVELQDFIDAAETAIGHRVGPLTPVSVTEVFDGGTDKLILRNPRAVSLTSLSYADGTTLTLSDYTLDPDTGIVYWAYGTAGRFTSGSRWVNVTYQAGWSSLPADLVQAVKELTRHLWETQRGNNTPARPRVTDETPVPGAYSTWPNRVRELVDPYTVPRVG